MKDDRIYVQHVQWRQRVPRSLHARLVAKARQEGVSLNTLVTAMIAEGLGERRVS